MSVCLYRAAELQPMANPAGDAVINTPGMVDHTWRIDTSISRWCHDTGAFTDDWVLCHLLLLMNTSGHVASAAKANRLFPFVSWACPTIDNVLSIWGLGLALSLASESLLLGIFWAPSAQETVSQYVSLLSIVHFMVLLKHADDGFLSESRG